MPSFSSLKDIKAPSLPKTPSLPAVPSLPKTPSLPHVPSLPKTPSLPHVPSIPSLPSLPSTPSLASLSEAIHSRILSRKVTLEDDPGTDETKSSKDSEKEEVHLEPVYIVLRPLHLSEAPEAYLKRLGRVVNAIEFENYIILQHWGVLIGDHYYHLHTDDEHQVSVSLQPFTSVDGKVRHTIKIPIWRTALKHDERVGIAVGIIKAMGRYSAETEVSITDERGDPVTSPEDRLRYRMEGRYVRPTFTLPVFGGKYSPIANNCIHFTKHYVFDQILSRRRELKRFSENIKWIVGKWGEMGCKRGPGELTKFLSALLGIGNPFSMTPEKSARLMIKLLSIFLNVPYHDSLDQKLLEDTPASQEAEDDLFDDLSGKSGENAEELYDAKSAETKPIPEEDGEGEKIDD